MATKNEHKRKSIVPLSLMVIIGVACISIVLWQCEVFRCGNVTGELIKFYTEDYGEYCGQYPYVRIRLRNFTIDGEISGFDECKNDDEIFYFRSYYPEGNELDLGEKYKFDYHVRTVLSDTGSSYNPVFYLDGVMEVK